MMPFKNAIVLLPFCLAACVLGYDERPDDDDCVNQTGNQWCKEKHGEELYCRRGFPECGRVSWDGCDPEPPVEPACYSPCGHMLSVADLQQSCEGYDGSTTTTGSTSAGTTTSSTTSSTGTTSEGTTSEAASESEGSGSSSDGTTTLDGPDGCLDHPDCTDPALPACGADGVCGACDVAEDGDSVCALLDPSAPLCRESSCVACEEEEEEDTYACPISTPACVDFQCVECTAETTAACSVERPVCFENACVACTADDVGACANEEAHPVCFENACVACTAEDRGACAGETPVCDAETNSCVPCTEHGQCESGVCNVDTGACFSAANVLVVEGAPGCQDIVEPFCEIGQAVQAIPEGQLRAVLVFARRGGTAYQESVTLDGGRTALFLAGTNVRPIILGNGGPGLTVSGGAVAMLEGIRVERGTNEGLLVTGEGSRAELDRCWVAQNSGGGIAVTEGAAIEVVNSFVSGVVDTDALAISGGTATIVYSTLAGRSVEGGTSRALACDEASTVVARNSFFVATNDADEVECDAASFSFSAAEMSLPGEGTVFLGPMELTWFTNIVQGDLHLNEPRDGLLRAARWQPGDPTVDIDGDPRVATEGEMGVAGADVP